MRRALCEQIPEKPGQSVEIPENEARHLISVLRLHEGNEIELLDGSGYRTIGTLWHQGKRLMAKASHAPESDPALLSKPVHLAMALLKNEAMEWVIEKSVELGVKTFTPVETEFCVIRMNKKGSGAFQERYQKIADQALKQCGRLERMTVLEPVTFEEFLKSGPPLFWLDESLARSAPEQASLPRRIESLKKDAECALLVGPEGGFSPAEKERLQKLSSLTAPQNREINRVHLGAVILRAETAALFGVSLLAGNCFRS